jgi:hypothetical protein
MFGLLLLLTITVHQPLIGLTALATKGLKGRESQDLYIIIRHLEDEREGYKTWECRTPLKITSSLFMKLILYHLVKLQGLFHRC